MGLFEMNLRPDTESRALLTVKIRLHHIASTDSADFSSFFMFLLGQKIVNYPVTRILKREEQALMWKYRYYLTQNKKVSDDV